MIDLNLLDIESIVTSFIEEHKAGLTTLHKIHNPNYDNLSYLSFITELTEELRIGCVTFVNNHDDLEGLDPYLFYIANAFAKQKSSNVVKKLTEYLCPGCLYLGKNNIITLSGLFFKCDECKASLELSDDPKKYGLFKIFKFHNKKGYKCPDCNRFIPHPMYNGNNIITCPYLDCCFVGDISGLKKMHHPNSQTNPEKLYADVSIVKSVSSSTTQNQLSQLEYKEDLTNKIKIINETIDNQSSNIPYNSTGCTLIHKLSVYQAIKNLLLKFPEDMVDYLLHQSRSGGFQNKIFQEYVRLLEQSFPVCYKKGNKVLRIDSLLSSDLNIFEGISTFDAIVTDKLDIKNNTQEFYIGGRKASYSQPYYIGKLLNVINKNTKQPLMHHVKDYSFSKIHMQDISPGMEVIVTHLRVPPHYQMGGMVYINRVRKKIVDKSLLILNKNE